MSVQSGFNNMQIKVNVASDDLAKARKRRDVFRSTLGTEIDVKNVIPSGSLARGSHCDPIHDVDIIVEFQIEHHSDWGQSGNSSEEALSYLSELINRRLGITNGSDAQIVRLAAPRNHAVKCFFDDPDDPNGFTVDAMPALRQDNGVLLVPEKASSRWIQTNPEYLINLVSERHSQWNEFVKLVRVLKRWNRDNGGIMKSLLIEVVAIECLKKDDHRGMALAKYFTAANVRLGYPVDDPAGLCGPIQPDLDVVQARGLLAKAANIAQRALDAENRGEDEAAMCHWHELFGDVYPEPSGGCNSNLISGTALTGVVATSRPAPRRVRDAPQG